LGNDENIYQVFGIKDKIYKLKGHTLTMGVFNATPDSFYLNTNHTMNQSFYEKSDVIDIGGESTRPGAKEVSLD
jgi:dihydropteroate synthase